MTMINVCSSSPSDEKALRALEEENNKLRDLLREAQQEIVNLNSSISSSNPSAKVSFHMSSLVFCFSSV